MSNLNLNGQDVTVYLNGDYGIVQVGATGEFYHLSNIRNKEHGYHGLTLSAFVRNSEVYAGSSYMGRIDKKSDGPTGRTYKAFYGRCEDAPSCGCCGQQDRRGTSSDAEEEEEREYYRWLNG